MTRKVRHKKKSGYPFHLAGLFAVLVAVAAWAHQQGIINWDLSAVSNLVTAYETGSALGGTSGAAEANCAEQFLSGQAPVLVNDKLKAKTRELCYRGFAVLHSGVTRTPLWSAEHLTATRVGAAKELLREDTFHADQNLSSDERAELDDYKGYGFDRGHMAPNGDMPDKESQAECFTLANMVPQNADNNRGIWKEIEESVRDLAEKDGDLYVVTGPVFSGEDVKTINDRVMVPTEIYKAVYDVQTHRAAAYLAENAPGRAYKKISIQELQALIGIEVFPSLPAATTSELALPAPGHHHAG